MLFLNDILVILIKFLRAKKYLNINPTSGLTNFLIDHELEVADVITNANDSSLDVIASGPIPPNPSELLTNGRFEEVLEYGKANYDYVIVDTAPVNIVTDTLLIGSQADLFVYVVRANYLDKRLLSVPKKMFENKKKSITPNPQEISTQKPCKYHQVYKKKRY